MAYLSQDALKSVAALVGEIRSLEPSFESLIEKFRTVIARLEEAQPEIPPRKRSASFWVFAAFRDALVRLRLFAEQNLRFVEPMGLLAVTRYVFELTVWLRRLQADPRYGLVYYRLLVAKQLDHHIDLEAHLKREMDFLRTIEDQETDLLRQKAEDLKRLPDERTQKLAASRLSDDVMREIDRRAARQFSLYAEQARTNGYGFQVHLIERQVLPRLAKSIAELRTELASLNADLPSEVRSLLPKGRDWKWKDEAKAVGMQYEYEFIYTYTSRLLHATPASLTTDQKNLEPHEILMFMRYIHVCLLDAIQMATDLLSSRTHTH